MDVRLDDSLNDFRDEVRTWLEEHLSGEFGAYRKGLTGHEDIPAEVQIAWEKELATGGWLGIDFPASIGGRECTLAEQVVFHLTYVEAKAPGRIPNMGVTLLGPTLMAFGSEAQQQRFVPKILSGDELWCQGYSEPDAGSDLSNVKTRADLVDGQWVVNGQKVWTSLAQFADWIFVVARTEAGSERHAGLSYLLMPMNQPGIEIRPIVQITGGTEFNETFFSDAVCDEDMVVGGVGNGWKVAMGTLAFERGASTLGQQVSFRQEFEDLLSLAKANGRWDDPVVRQNSPRPTSVSRFSSSTNCACSPPSPTTACPAPRRRSASSTGRAGIAAWANSPCSSPDPKAWSRVPTATTDTATDPTIRSTSSSGPSCTPGRTPSMAAPTRFSATCSASASLACPRAAPRRTDGTPTPLIRVYGASSFAATPSMRRQASAVSTSISRSSSSHCRSSRRPIRRPMLQVPPTPGMSPIVNSVDGTGVGMGHMLDAIAANSMPAPTQAP